MLDLLVTQLHPLAPIILGLPWLQSMNPVMDWSNLTLAFRSGLKSSLPPMTVAMSCVTAAPHHEDIILHISPLFVSIPELQCTDTSESRNMTLPAEPNFPAANGTQLVAPTFPDDSNPLPVAPKFPDNSNPLPVAPKFPDNSDLLPVIPKFPDNLDTHPMDPNFTVETDSLRDLATLGYVLNMAPTKLHSAVPTLAALGSPFYDISSKLSLNLPTQDLGFTPVQSPYEPFSFPSSPYNPLPFLEEMDAILFKRQESPSISLVGATAFQKLID